MKVMFLLAALIAVVLWQRHENGNLTRSFERRTGSPPNKKRDRNAEKSAFRFAESPGEMKPRRSVTRRTAGRRCDGDAA
jgi:hypothetical protein